MGPRINAAGLQTTRDHLADAVQEGASVLAGGKAPEGKEFTKGFFFLPTVFSGVTPEMMVMRAETFGPLAPIATFK